MTKRRIAISNRQSRVAVDRRALRGILGALLAQAAPQAELSVALVGDREMSALNERYLGCKETTDVLAFPYARSDDCMEGEVVVNADQAARQAERRGHRAQDELLLYAVHGLLHLMGCDDHDPAGRKAMHERALSVLAEAGRELKS